MLEDRMVPDLTSLGIGRFVARIVIDDRSRLPGKVRDLSDLGA